METQYDVIVVGSGPAGSAASSCLAENGLRVALLEKEPLPRYKTCGGGVVRRASLLAALPDSEVIERSCDRADLVSTGYSFRLQRSYPFLFMTMRAAMDSWLVQRAIDQGVRLYEKERFIEARVVGDRVQVQTDQRQFQARYLIGADGVHSHVARCMGWKQRPHCIPALESEIHVSPSDYERLSVPRFDFDVLPHGYAWVFPKQNHLSVGVLTMLPEKVPLPNRLQEYLEFLRLTPQGSFKKHGWLIPVRPRPGVLAARRTLLVGDALGLADPVTCEGISYALMSGQLAARAITKGGEFAEVRETYQRDMESQVLRDLRWGWRLSRLLYRNARVRRLLFKMGGDLFCQAIGRVICGETTYSGLLGNATNYGKLLKRMVVSGRV